jgi:hypothetical protein
VFCDKGRASTVEVIAGSMGGVARDILERAIKNFHKCDP